MATWIDNLPELPAAGLTPLLPEAAGTRKSAAKLDSGGTIRQQVDRRRMVRLVEIRNAAQAIGTLPEPTESVHAVMSGTFDGFAILPGVLTLAAPAKIAELTIATLGFNRRNADELFAMLDAGTVGACTLVASNYFKSVDTELFAYIHNGLTARGQRCAILRSHAKLLLMKLTDGRAFVWESSANLRSCRNVETFSLCQSRELLEFHVAWIEELIAKAEKEAR
jgi:hypothetical protein